ncbi:TerB family tellurite resistance protein [Antarctobacter jejuensis]|uniref:TerB family tellurite resistance protein n=1 Tax=Antarctobacter jejuensis TaxID=1439938 RepID=UPI003FD1BFE8
MFERLKAFFHHGPKQPEPLPEPDAKLALGTLLVRVARADNTYLFEEISQIDRILVKAFDLNPVEAAKMRATCEKLANTITDNAKMAALIRDNVDYAHRIETVQAMWQVVWADGITDAREAAMVALIEEWLGVEAHDNEAARAAAVIP